MGTHYKQKCVKRYGLDKLLRVEDLICEGGSMEAIKYIKNALSHY